MRYDRPFGGETGKGWSEIILHTHEKLKIIDPYYTIGQIKEKFGGLRYYYDTSMHDNIRREIMDDVISMAELRASRTCEICGTDKHDAGVETRVDHYWYYTYCKSCSDKHLEERNQRFGRS